MKKQFRNIIVLFFVTMSFIPFLFMTDLFPFMRFGMFAETVKNIPQRETFLIFVIKSDGSKEALSKRQIGLDDSHLNYLTRKYYYNRQLHFFTDQLKKSGLLQDNEKLLVIQELVLGNDRQQKIIFNQ